jgi:hypothetical protein
MGWNVLSWHHASRRSSVARLVAEALVQALVVVEPEAAGDARARASATDAQSFKYTSSYFRERHSRSTKMLSMQRPARPC